MTETVRRERIRFVGRVQGVGFRMTVRNLANGRPISGWVRNESDGSVTCVAEGPGREIHDFLAAIQEVMSGHITSHDRMDEPVGREDLVGFSIKYDPDTGR